MSPVFADLRPYLKGFLGTLAALLLVSLALIVWRLYTDHQILHQLIAVLNTLAGKHPDLFK
jgi:hypothetical protein